jgi:hypothetical protein
MTANNLLQLAMVAETAPAEVLRMWRQHLMVPPSAAVAAHVRSALGILVAMGQGASVHAVLGRHQHVTGLL